MPRSLILAILFAASACAAIWPEQLGRYERKSIKKVIIPDRVGSDEYGSEESEEANYGEFEILAQRFKDSTGAYAVWLLATGESIQVGNYLITCTGSCPKNLAELAEQLPRVSHAPLPALGSYLPKKNMAPHSQRYILGPIGLKQYAPTIPQSAVAFQFGTEGAIASYRILRNEPKSEAILAIFSYPTPQIARQQAPAFESISGAAVKRTGPLVALVLGAPDRAAADQLLSQINYEASVTINEPLPLVLTPQSTAQMLLAIITLAGIVLAFCLASGLLFGGLRVIARKFGYTDAGTAMTTLHLSDK